MVAFKVLEHHAALAADMVAMLRDRASEAGVPDCSVAAENLATAEKLLRSAQGILSREAFEAGEFAPPQATAPKAHAWERRDGERVCADCGAHFATTRGSLPCWTPPPMPNLSAADRAEAEQAEARA